MSTTAQIKIVEQHVGGPKKIQTNGNSMYSAIGRQSVTGPVALSLTGLAGDAVADKRFHGSPDQAISCHSASHYGFWNAEFGLIGTPKELHYGALGENWTLSECDETTMCIGDTFRAGSAVVQVSQPRTPCWKQEAKTGLPDLLSRTTQTLKTGFYMRVIEPGEVSAGDELFLIARPHPEFTVASICDFRFHKVNPDLIRKAVLADELATTWKASLRNALSARA